MACYSILVYLDSIPRCGLRIPRIARANGDGREQRQLKFISYFNSEGDGGNAFGSLFDIWLSITMLLHVSIRNIRHCGDTDGHRYVASSVRTRGRGEWDIS